MKEIIFVLLVIGALYLCIHNENVMETKCESYGGHLHGSREQYCVKNGILIDVDTGNPE